MSALIPRWSSNRLQRRIDMEKDLQQNRLIMYRKLNKLFGLDPLDLLLDLAELAKQAEQDEQAIEEDYYSPTSYTYRNMPTPDLGGEPLVSVPASVEELGTSLELAEQAVDKEKTVSPASEPCLNMASPKFGDEQAYLVPPSVDQLGTKLSTPNIRLYHVPDCATHIAPAKSPADVVPSSVLIMDFRNLQYRRHVKHLVDHTDVASIGSNTYVYAYSS